MARTRELTWMRWSMAVVANVLIWGMSG